MTIQQSLKRLSYTVANGNKSNQTDVDALNVVLDWYNATKEERLNTNHHFCKITLIYYCELLQRYSWDKFLAEKQIQQILEQPLKEQYERFMRLMNIKEWYDASSVLGLNLELVLSGKTREEIEHIKNADRKIMKDNQKELLQSINPWGIDEITSQLNDFLSELIVKYEDK